MFYLLKRIYAILFYFMVQYRDKRLDGYFLMGSPLKFICVLVFYLYFVLKWGPKFMEKRKPYNLDGIIKVYNITQVVCNGILGCLSIKYAYDRYRYNLDCVLPDYGKTGLYEAQMTYCYYLLKIADLFDTIFFVLRKKYKQISFLHLYHHSAILFGAYLFAQYIPGGHGSILGIINCFVHAFMYFYYFMTLYKPQLKQNIWWKKYITQLQMIQFIIIILFFIPPFFNPDCNYTKFGLLIGIMQNLFMLLMFADFYRKAYMKKNNNIVNEKIE